MLAEPTRQQVVRLAVPARTTAWEALLRSGLIESREDLDATVLGVAIHGRKVEKDHELEPGDRVEVLRPLSEDPRNRRRRLARAGRTR